MSGHSVVLLHGIWMPGSEMLVVKRRLEAEYDFDCHIFSYASVRRGLDDNASQLATFAKALNASTMHLVGHSLGGILALRMLATSSDIPPGRVVCLGSPLCGSRAATEFGRRRWGRAIIGDSLPEGVVTEPASSWAGEVLKVRDVGVIAGSRSAGLGRFFAAFDEANDGTVAVEETRLPGAKDHIVLNVSHTGMILSRAVADQTAAFLKRGKFLRED